MEDIHSFENTVLAVFDRVPAAEEVISRLGAAGYEVEVLEGESGSAHLDPEGEEGLWAALKRAATSLSDEKRVLDRLDSELSEGNIVVSVDISDREAKEAISILREEGGRYLWKFGDWTFTPIEV
jgi:hypothetical protein